MAVYAKHASLLLWNLTLPEAEKRLVSLDAVKRRNDTPSGVERSTVCRKSGASPISAPVRCTEYSPGASRHPPLGGGRSPRFAPSERGVAPKGPGGVLRVKPMTAENGDAPSEIFSRHLTREFRPKRHIISWDFHPLCGRDRPPGGTPTILDRIGAPGGHALPHFPRKNYEITTEIWPGNSQNSAETKICHTLASPPEIRTGTFRRRRR